MGCSPGLKNEQRRCAGLSAMRTRGGGGAELAARSQVCYFGLPGPAERRAGLLRRGQGGQAGRRRVGDVKSRRRSRGAAGLRCCGGRGVCRASGRGWRRRGVRLGLRRAGPGIAGAVGEGNPRWFRRGSRRAERIRCARLNEGLEGGASGSASRGERPSVSVRRAG